MSLTSITLEWADGEKTFDLPLGQIRELQEKTGVGPFMLKNRFISGEWRVDDIRETIRLGLIGGGLKPSESLSLVQRYIDARIPAESLPVAYAIILAWLLGVPTAKKNDESQKETTTEPDASTSETSMQQQPQ